MMTPPKLTRRTALMVPLASLGAFGLSMPARASGIDQGRLDKALARLDRARAAADEAFEAAGVRDKPLPARWGEDAEELMEHLAAVVEAEEDVAALFGDNAAFAHRGRLFVYEPGRDPGIWTSTLTLMTLPMGAVEGLA
jgi:hypothetical protein